MIGAKKNTLKCSNGHVGLNIFFIYFEFMVKLAKEIVKKSSQRSN